MHIVYLDEFGHVGPYVSRTDPKYKESPVFGMAGLMLPADQARDFAMWFFKRKSELLRFEINEAKAQPATWEKKGAALYTTTNVTKYRQLRAFTNRLFNHVHSIGGHVIYVGLHKQVSPEKHKSSRLYLATLREMVKRINGLCQHDPARPNFLLVMDEHQDRDSIITAVAKGMFSRTNPNRRLIEPPFQVESHRYQTIQAADWICGLIGRYAAFKVSPDEYKDWEWTERYFGDRIRRVSIASGVRGDRRIQESKLIADEVGQAI